jgi:hypothetical protein
MAIVWLASYPRSGNTWLRFLLQSYLNAGEIDGTRLSADIPDIHNTPQINPDASDRLLVKSHFMWSGQRHPYADKTRGFIYILRHPKDVLLSFLNYRKLGGVIPVGDAEVDRRYAMLFCRGLGDYEWSARFGPWPHHIVSWLMRPAHPHAVVRYENLLATPEQELKPVLKLLGLPIDESRLHAAIEACRFSKLREMEQKEKTVHASEPADQRFFDGIPALAEQGVMFINKGEAGQTLHHLGADVEETFNKTFERYLTPLGYGLTGGPVARTQAPRPANGAVHSAAPRPRSEQKTPGTCPT